MKLAIISGGSRGLGAALCKAYSDAGFEVLEFSRRAPHPFSIACDFTQPQDVSECVSASFSPYRDAALDELVVISNVASLDPIAPNTRLDAAAIQRNLSTSFVSAIVFMSEALRAFQAHACRKTLVSVSSGAALKGYAGWSLYCASKAGLENYLRAVAAEQQLERFPFGTMNIDPGVMDTEMQALIRDTPSDNFPARERFITLHQEGLLRAPATIAAAFVRMTSRGDAQGARLVAADFLPGTSAGPAGA